MGACTRYSIDALGSHRRSADFPLPSTEGLGLPSKAVWTRLRGVLRFSSLSAGRFRRIAAPAAIDRAIDFELAERVSRSYAVGRRRGFARQSCFTLGCGAGS